jgi:phage-related protein
MSADLPSLKPLGWIGSSYKDLLALPKSVIREFGYALYRAQRGEMPMHAKALKGFGDGSVVEIVEDWDGSTYRAVYTVRYREVVYVLHVFEKKSKSGKATPKTDLDLIKKRLKVAEQEYQRWRGSEAKR